MKFIIIFCVSFLTFITGCELDQKKLENTNKPAALEGSKRQEAINRIIEIKKKYEYPDFHYWYDGTLDMGRFDIRTTVDYEKPLPEGLLWIRIMDDGRLALSSVYRGEHIYHTQIELITEDTVITSPEIYYGDPQNIVERFSETLWFHDEDNGIFKEIISASGNQKITIRLFGEEGEFTFKLSKEDIQKLKDANEFAGLLVSLNMTAKQLADIFGY